MHEPILRGAEYNNKYSGRPGISRSSKTKDKPSERREAG
jgi:hypothetical protein